MMRFSSIFFVLLPVLCSATSKPGILLGAQKDEALPEGLAQFALDHLESSTNNFFSRRIVKVTDVRSQTVSGKVYTFTLELGPTSCPKRSKRSTSETCPLTKAAADERCKVKVWTRPWMDYREVTEQSCEAISPPPQKEVKMKPLDSDELSAKKLRKLQRHSNFKRFVKKYGRNYADAAEYKRRYRNFRENMKIIQFLRETELGSGRYGVTQFADYSHEEKKQFLGFKTELHRPGLLQQVNMSHPDFGDLSKLPVEFDWREKGAVTPVKNQGSCGSCWSFSVTGNVEGQWKLKTGKLLSLSEQELVDCDKEDHGCNGGLPSIAYKQIAKLGGLESEEDYVYDGVQEKCHFNKSKVVATVKDGIQLSKNETELKAWLVKNGPISIGINANAMMFYYGGVSHPWHFLCRSSGLDHGVLIVGYGVDHISYLKKTLPFWIIKNSWGKNWGEQGYYRVFRGDGTCGVNQMATSAVV